MTDLIGDKPDSEVLSSENWETLMTKKNEEEEKMISAGEQEERKKDDDAHFS